MSEPLSEVGAAPAVAEPAAAPEPVAVEPLAEGAAAGDATAGLEPQAPAAPEAPTVDPADLQAQLEYVQSQYSELANYLQGLEQPQQQGQQQPGAQPGQLDVSGLVDEFGQLTPEGLIQALAVQQQAITQAIEQRFQTFTQPFEQQRVEQAYNAGLESAKDMLGDNVSRFGEFAADPEADAIARERVLDVADSLLVDPAFQARYGNNNPRAAEIAIQQAADRERTYLNSVRGQGAAQAANRLATLAGAAQEPGVGAVGGVAGTPEFNSPADVRNYYAAQARQIQQNGGAAA